MPAKAVADAVEARLIANWGTTPIIGYDTQAQPPDDADAFVVVQYPIANGAQPVLGRTFWEEGAFRIVLNMRRGIGLAQGLEWADTLATLYRRVKFSAIETFVPDGPIIDDNIENGNWISYAVIVPYRYEYRSALPVLAVTGTGTPAASAADIAGSGTSASTGAGDMAAAGAAT